MVPLMGLKNGITSLEIIHDLDPRAGGEDNPERRKTWGGWSPRSQPVLKAHPPRLGTPLCRDAVLQDEWVQAEIQGDVKQLFLRGEEACPTSRRNREVTWGNYSSGLCLYSSVFSRISYEWNSVVCCVWSLFLFI